MCTARKTLVAYSTTYSRAMRGALGISVCFNAQQKGDCSTPARGTLDIWRNKEKIEKPHLYSCSKCLRAPSCNISGSNSKKRCEQSLGTQFRSFTLNQITFQIHVYSSLLEISRETERRPNQRNLEITRGHPATPTRIHCRFYQG